MAEFKVINKVLSSITTLADIPSVVSDGTPIWMIKEESNAFTEHGFDGYTSVMKTSKVCPRLLLEQVVSLYGLDDPITSSLSEATKIHEGLKVSEWKDSLMCIPKYLMLGEGPIILANKKLWFPDAQSKSDAIRYLKMWEEANGTNIVRNPSSTLGDIITLLRKVLGDTPEKILGKDQYIQITKRIKSFPAVGRKAMACLSSFGIEIDVDKDTHYGEIVGSGGSGHSRALSNVNAGVATRVAVGSILIGITAFLIHRARK
jgi:hypothetical protein